MTSSADVAAGRWRRCCSPASRPLVTRVKACCIDGWPSSASGPSWLRCTRVVSTAASRYVAAAAPTITASAEASVMGSSCLTPVPRPSPTTNARVPLVGVKALAKSSRSRSTTCGNAAESPARKNRLMLKAITTRTNSKTPLCLEATTAATASTGRVRTRLHTSRTCRRLHLSRKTPVNGPRMLNGSSTAASAAAIPWASGCLSGENRTYDASATWKMPSAHWLVTRTAKSRRNGASFSNEPRSPRNRMTGQLCPTSDHGA